MAGLQAGRCPSRTYLAALSRNFLLRQGTATGRQTGVSGGLGGERGALGDVYGRSGGVTTRSKHDASVGSPARGVKSAASISQDDLAARCTRQGFDIGRGTISHIETGLRGVSDLEMVLLAKALRVKLGRVGARRLAGVREVPPGADGGGWNWGLWAGLRRFRAPEGQHSRSSARGRQGRLWCDRRLMPGRAESDCSYGSVGGRRLTSGPGGPIPEPKNILRNHWWRCSNIR